MSRHRQAFPDHRCVPVRHRAAVAGGGSGAVRAATGGTEPAVTQHTAVAHHAGRVCRRVRGQLRGAARGGARGRAAADPGRSRRYDDGVRPGRSAVRRHLAVHRPGGTAAGAAAGGEPGTARRAGTGGRRYRRLLRPGPRRGAARDPRRRPLLIRAGTTLAAMPGVPPTRFVYLGPEGTFSEQALLTLPAAVSGVRLPARSVPEALERVRGGEADAALVPLENSIGGQVGVTLDELVNGTPLLITREVVLPVEFVLAARPGTVLAQVRRIAAHPQAGAQCRHWLRANLPDAAVVDVLSNAAAAVAVARGEYEAAICAP